ncbi:MAG: orotate phosphoribosyltransferase [Caulobacteraceae bacterium]|nr:orotate phosphoribosyltransferase [Caulobacteraceae bacterium]
MTPDETELRDLIRARSYRFGAFTLASGRESQHYFNLKPTMMTPRGALLAARAFLDRIHAERVEAVGGIEMGAVPLIGALAAVGEIEGRPIPTFFVRKAPKAHGTRATLEGLAPGESLAGKRVMALDDVATTGGSVMKAVEAARAERAVVETALVLVDREEGGAEALAAQGVRLISVLRKSDF